MIAAYGIILFMFTMLTAANSWDLGYKFGKKEERQKVVILCNQKPVDCKTEYEFYKLQKEVQTIQKGESK